MCETNAYVYHEGIEELYLEGLDVLRPGGNSFFLKSLFGEKKAFEGEIREIALLQHKVALQKR
ncbi:MAG: hypothetical protein OHK006_07000 [Thermodesulfovibrionales bacterium]